MSGKNPREIAVRVLRRRAEGRFTENLLEEELAGAPLSPADRRLCQELVYGVVRWQAALDWLVARKTGGRQQKEALQILLRLGLYQVFWLERVPDHAAVHETVELAKTLGLGPQAGFVNAVLRGYLREADPTRVLLQRLKLDQPHLGFSHPEWLVQRWLGRWGPEKTAALLEWNNSPPGVFARVNTLKTDPGKLLQQWREQENVEYDFVRRDWLDENLVFVLTKHPPLTSLPSFQAGLFYVQDPSTLLAVRQLDVKPGQDVLDLCAAPGGKTTFVAQLTGNNGQLVAHDTGAERLETLRANCSRLGVSAKVVDNLGGLGLFDRILVDAPCSNTGVVNRRIDLRWRIRPEEISRLRKLQLELLGNASAHLKPGGTLVYSTCSLEPDENQWVIRDFLEAHKNFTLSNERELVPFVDKVDGAYTARLVAS